MNATECIKKLSPVLFWDIDKSQADMDKFPSFFVQRVLEYGNWNVTVYFSILFTKK